MKNSKPSGDPLFGSSEMIWDALAYAQTKRRPGLEAHQISHPIRRVTEDHARRKEDVPGAAQKLI